MQLSLSLGFRASRQEADPRAGKLHSVLLAASRTDFYARKLKGSRLRTPEAMAALHPVESAIAAFPPVPLKLYLDNREHFRNAGVRTAAVAIDRVHTVPHGWRAKLGFPAEALAGPQEELVRLAARVQAGEAAPAPTARRLVVYTRLGERLLGPDARERLWAAFELPIFEQLHGFDGELLASECDAHEGMHLETGSAVFEELDGELVITSLLAVRTPVLRLQTGLAGSIATHTCPCGTAAARFLPAPAVAATRKPPSLERETRALLPRAVTGHVG